MNRKTNKIILLPEMLEYHSRLLEAVFAACHINARFLDNKGNFKAASLPYLNNEFCYPLYQITGQLLCAVEQLCAQGIAPSTIVFVEPSVGDACRSGNYLAAIKRGMEKAGYPEVEIAPLSVADRGQKSAFPISLKLVRGAIAAFCYGDALMQYYQEARLYDRHKEVHDVEELYERLQTELCGKLSAGKGFCKKEIRENILRIKEAFAPYTDVVSKMEMEKGRTYSGQKKKAGIAGEIYMKFCKLGNHDLEMFLTENRIPYMSCGLMNYVLYRIDAEITKAEITCTVKTVRKCMQIFEDIVLSYQHILAEELHIVKYEELRQRAQQLVSSSLVVGDGWLVGAEIIELIDCGCTNILVLHPFDCMISHVCERGIMKKFHSVYPEISIQVIEYDYDSTEALLQSRIMLAVS